MRYMAHIDNPEKFQSSPSCGGRRDLQDGYDAIYYFNPRPRVEGDTIVTVWSLSVNISILALVWRATAVLQMRRYLLIYFNPRPRVEGDIGCAGCNTGKRVFQSSPSCGGRPPLLFSIVNCLFISILALVWRATDLVRVSFSFFKDFNPRPRVEGDARPRTTARATANFNPRPRVEGDFCDCF